MKFAKLRRWWFKFLIGYDVQVGIFVLTTAVCLVVGFLGWVL